MRMAKNKTGHTLTKPSNGEAVEKLEASSAAGGTVHPLRETGRQFLMKLDIQLPGDSGFSPREK